MGIYVNPGNEGFATIVRGRYVDKTGLVTLVNRALDTPDRLVCVSRPRRFGKSFAAQSLVAYYCHGCDSRPLFSGLEVSRDPSFERHLNAYDVISLDITDIIERLGAGSQVAPVIQRAVVDDLRGEYPEVVLDDDLGGALLAVCAHTGRKFVFVIDEWDAVFREAQQDASAQRAYVGLLRSLFKSNTVTPRAIAAAYLTGILPIKKYGTQSAMNDFREYTMVSPAHFAPYVGFTETEVRELCGEYGMDFEGMQHWYDGYDLPGTGSVYAPNSVMQACQRRQLATYWTTSETYESLRLYIDMDFDGLQAAIVRALGGEELAVDPSSFQNDMVSIASVDDVLTLLVHLGYLAYDARQGTARIPNEEVRIEFRNALRQSHHSQIARIVRDSDALLQLILDGDEQAVAAAIAHAHDTGTAPAFYNNEQALRAVVKAALISAVDHYATIEELPSGRGVADIVYLPRLGTSWPALVVELKGNRTAQAAISQICDRDYPAVLRDWGGPVLLVGVGYDPKTKAHGCRIEELTELG